METEAPALRAPAARRVARWGWAGLRLAVALLLFIGALQIMKTGASGVEFLHEGGALVRNWGSTLGLGWIGAMFTLSGSPIIATGLTLGASGHISELQSFTMVTGARMGAAFVVLLVAVLFASRRGTGQRMAPISTAVMALVITIAMYVPGAVIGASLLGWEDFSSINVQSPPTFAGIVDLIYGPLLELLEPLPAALLFVGGLALLVISFKMIDALVPELDESRFGGERLQWLRRKWPMFFLGVIVTIATMSVSVSLSVLVPLVGKGYVKREDLVAYIVGADIGTLVDKLLIAFIVGLGALHPALPVRVILAEIAGVTVMGVAIMAFAYLPFRRAIWRFQRQMVRSRGRLAAFTAGLLVVPVGIMVIAGVVG